MKRRKQNLQNFLILKSEEIWLVCSDPASCHHRRHILCVISQSLFVVWINFWGYCHSQFSCRECFRETKSPFGLNHGVGGMGYWNSESHSVLEQLHGWCTWMDLPHVLLCFLIPKFYNPIRRALISVQINVIFWSTQKIISNVNKILHKKQLFKTSFFSSTLNIIFSWDNSISSYYISIFTSGLNICWMPLRR